jgi:hypothetical protein
MNAAVRWGLVLGGVVAALTVIFGFAGWHRTYQMAFVFLAVAISANVATVVLCLRESAASERWSGQIKNGLLLGLVASAIIFAASWLTTTVIFPDYFAEMAEGYREAYVSLGLSADDVAELVEATAATSPVRSAFDGVIGTTVTSLVVAAVAGVWLRRKD